ncbi:MAG: DMT family transporter [Flavobacteriaceae bacterium]
MKKRYIAFFAAFMATSIYAINHTLAKGVMPDLVKPFGFIFLRTAGAAVLFWGVSLFLPKEKIEKKDWPRLLLATVLGMSINMLAFFKGLELSTPINSAVLVSITPICTLILSAIIVKEKITFNKAFGIIIGFIGALGLILFGHEERADAPNIFLGNSLFVLNAFAYGAYLVIVRKLMMKYSPTTLLKYMFTIATIINFPVTYPEFSEIQWSVMPLWAFGTIAFVVVGVTFMTYVLNGFAMKQLKASTIGVFTYVQPLMGIIFAISMGKDQMSSIKLLAAILVIGGVYLGSMKPKSAKLSV